MTDKTLLGGGRSSQSDGKTLRATILLIRKSKDGKAVYGSATIQMGKDAIVCSTLENDDFIIPDGTYELTLTMSPKFGVVLPLLCGVTGRSGIRIHTGTKPEHSKGCVLVTPFGKKQITDFIHQNYMNNEKTFIHIDSDGLRGSGHDEL